MLAGTASTERKQTNRGGQKENRPADPLVRHGLVGAILCCPCCMVTKKGWDIPPVVWRLPCWSVTMVMTLWPLSLTIAACWMLESKALAAIASSDSPVGGGGDCFNWRH